METKTANRDREVSAVFSGLRRCIIAYGKQNSSSRFARGIDTHREGGHSPVPIPICLPMADEAHEINLEEIEFPGRAEDFRNHFDGELVVSRRDRHFDGGFLLHPAKRNVLEQLDRVEAGEL